jgi:hypothetical protein
LHEHRPHLLFSGYGLGESKEKLPRKDSPLLGSHPIGIFHKLLLITPSGRLGIKVSKAINLKSLIIKGRNRQAPKGIPKPFGGFA